MYNYGLDVHTVRRHLTRPQRNITNKEIFTNPLNEIKKPLVRNGAATALKDLGENRGPIL